MTKRAVIAFDCLFPNQLGGGERVYRAIADELVNQGWTVEYLTRDEKSDTEATFQVTSIWSGNIYDSQGARLVPPAVKFAFALFQALRKRRGYDLYLVSATPVFNVFAASMALGSRSRRALVIDWLEIWPSYKWRAYSGSFIGSIAAILQTVALRLTTLATVNSRETFRRLPKRIQRLNPVVLPLAGINGVVSHAATRTTENPVVLFVGRLIPDKRAHTIPGAFSEVRSAIPHAQLFIIGIGPEEEAIRAEISRLGIDEHCHMLGRVSDEDLQMWLSQASVLINPSIREGYGLVITEAAAHGTPSVVVPGPENTAADLIVSGVNGFLARSHAPADLAIAITNAIHGGEELRSSTVDWYRREIATDSLGAAVNRLIAQVSDRRSRGS